MTALVPTHLMSMLLVLLLQSTGLLLLGLLALRLTRGRGPAVQTLVGRASLVSVALLALLVPLTGHISPVVKVPRPTPSQVTTLPEREGEEIRAVGVDTTGSADRNAEVAVSSSAKGTAETDSTAARTGAASSALALPSPPTPTSITLRPPAPGGPLRSNLLRSKEVGSLWAAVSALLLLWLGVCQWHLTRLRRTAQAITTGPAVTLLAELTPNPPCLLTHSSIHSPFLAGYVRPVIFLPPAFETDFSADALRAIFVHELAHRDRRDNLWTLAARLLSALLRPQPLLWLLIRRLEQISEDACDEAVLSRNCPPRVYADCLLSLATRPPLTHRQRTLNAGVAPFRSSVGRRISRILANKGAHTMSPISLRLRLTAAALTLAVALGGAFLVSSAPAQVQAGAAMTSQVPSTTPSIGSKAHVSKVRIPASKLSPRQAKFRPTTAEINKYLEMLLNSSAGNTTLLAEARFLADLTPVQGPGVVVTLNDSKKPFPGGLPAGMMPPNIIHDSDINQVINELKAAGAEAIAVNGQRLVATSSIRCVGPVVNVNNVLQAPPFVIKAIGYPKALASVMTLPGGVGTQLKAFDPAMFVIQQAQMLTLPAYTGEDTPRYARPVRKRAAQASGTSSLQKRTFLVNFRAPAHGEHIVQVFVSDTHGRRPAYEQVCPPGSAVSFPVTAAGRSVSFQIYVDGKLTKTQQMTGGFASAAELQAQRKAGQVQMEEVGARIAALNSQIQAMRKRMQQKPYAFAPPSPPDTMNQNRLLSRENYSH